MIHELSRFALILLDLFKCLQNHAETKRTRGTSNEILKSLLQFLACLELPIVDGYQGPVQAQVAE